MAGNLGSSDLFPLLLGVGAVGAWAWMRQRELGMLSILGRAVRGGVAFWVIGVALALCFKLGQLVGGNT